MIVEELKVKSDDLLERIEEEDYTKMRGNNGSLLFLSCVGNSKEKEQPVQIQYEEVKESPLDKI